MAATPFEISPTELAARLKEPDPPLVLDVRTDAERRMAVIQGSLHVPLHALPRRLGELDRGREIAVLCHLGGRSALAVQWMRAAGFSRARNLDGGIDRWAADIDPGIPRY